MVGRGTPEIPGMGTESTWGGRKWPVRDPCPPVGHLAIWAPETRRAIVDEALT
jgi:hypothetical protein